MATDKRFSVLTNSYERTRAARAAPAGLDTASQAAEAARWRSELAAEVRLREAAEQRARQAERLQEQAEARAEELQASTDEIQRELTEKKERFNGADVTIATLRTQLEHATVGATAHAHEQRQEMIEYRSRLEHESATRAQVQQDLAAERALRDGLLAQITREHETTTALNARLEQAIAAGARPAPEVAPPTYDMVVTGRDPNNRPRTIRLTPTKE